jgi:hypothetical protein
MEQKYLPVSINRPVGMGRLFALAGCQADRHVANEDLADYSVRIPKPLVLRRSIPSKTTWMLNRSSGRFRQGYRGLVLYCAEEGFHPLTVGR